ncbi:F-box/kelch-repeat protein At3g23880 isoform X2 [Jatropha curcas]|nr:F-box/kelch-repeat protein At3g23880 isoform X2 [Jatropha curcas]XP_037494012.1 F-box/kelch-repeat protein At3g23880 isoform X2 [Jatropha curcas]
MVIPEFDIFNGSCDGLLLFLAPRRTRFEENHIIICNPCTKELIKIPVTRPVVHFPPDSIGPREDLFGLGYDPHTDDYKVIRFPSVFKAQEYTTFDKKDGFKCLVEAYSLKNKSWKTIQDGGFMYLMKRVAPSTVNRRPHWIATHITNPNSSRCVIFYFDAGKDNFGDMVLPPSVQKNVSVHNYRGFLGLAEYSIRGDFILWSIEEYGKPDSWAKLLTISNVPGPQRHIWYHGPGPVFITETGKVLIRTREGQLLVYDGKDGKFIEPLIQGHSDGFLCRIPYIESLVSPSGGNLRW